MTTQPTRLRLYQVDAFTDRRFAGNPAALCPLADWLETDCMQAIAAENNLSETAFFVGGSGHYELRWFTPTVEVDLCGHATLASAWLLFEQLGETSEAIRFETRSGRLTVRREEHLLSMELPSIPADPCTPPPALLEGLASPPVATLRATNYVAVYDDAKQVAGLTPNFARLATLAPYGVIATAPGRDCDFVSRYFAPSFGIDEDPVTGSAHCTLTPYWADLLGKSVLDARQISARGGRLRCTNIGHGRVAVAGTCVLYLEGEIRIGAAG